MTPPGWKCPKRIGYLFPHPCTRLTPEGCPDCQGGQVDDPYMRRTDRYDYGDYDDYDIDFGDVGGLAVADLADMSFSEADGESMVTPDDSFEDDLSAS